MLRGAFTIARISGVPVRIHWTFPLLLAWVFGAKVVQSGSLADGLVSLAFVVSLFACVVAHEFGHVLAARSFGVRTRDVILLPIGGVASLERIPERAWQELVVAVAGPLVNVVIALALLPGLLWAPGGGALAALSQPDWSGRSFVASVAAINVWLVVFNMIPAFPMDGGRVLRALLAMVMDRRRATRAAASVGQVIAVGMALLGILGGMPMLVVLALFVFFAAGAEAAGTEAQELLRGAPVSSVMVRSFRVLGVNERLGTAADELLTNSQVDFPVTRDGTRRLPVVGMLTRTDLVRALAERGPSASVGEAMRPACPSIGPQASAEEASRKIHAGQCPMIPVVAAGEIVGLLTGENLSEALLVRAALDRNQARGGAG